jgi:hypothetical protein
MKLDEVLFLNSVRVGGRERTRLQSRSAATEDYVAELAVVDGRVSWTDGGAPSWSSMANVRQAWQAPPLPPIPFVAVDAKAKRPIAESKRR